MAISMLTSTQTLVTGILAASSNISKFFDEMVVPLVVGARATREGCFPGFDVSVVLPRWGQHYWNIISMDSAFSPREWAWLTLVRAGIRQAKRINSARNSKSVTRTFDAKGKATETKIKEATCSMEEPKYDSRILNRNPTVGCLNPATSLEYAMLQPEEKTNIEKACNVVIEDVPILSDKELRDRLGAKKACFAIMRFTTSEWDLIFKTFSLLSEAHKVTGQGIIEQFHTVRKIKDEKSYDFNSNFWQLHKLGDDTPINKKLPKLTRKALRRALGQKEEHFEYPEIEAYIGKYPQLRDNFEKLKQFFDKQYPTQNKWHNIRPSTNDVQQELTVSGVRKERWLTMTATRDENNCSTATQDVVQIVVSEFCFVKNIFGVYEQIRKR